MDHRHISNLLLYLYHLDKQWSLVMLHDFNWHLLNFYHYLNFRNLHNFCFDLSHHYLLFDLNKFGRQLDDSLNWDQFFDNLRHLNNSFSIANELDYLLMCFWNNLVFGNNNRIVFFYDFVDSLLHQFLLNDRHSYSPLSLNNPLHYFLNQHFDRFYPLFHCLNVSNLVSDNLLNFQLLLNHNFIFSWNLDNSILFDHYLHFCGHFHRFRFLDNLIDWHLTILRIN